MVWLVLLHYLLYIFYILIATVILSNITVTNLISYQEKNPFAYAHIFIDTPNTITKNIDNYQLVFLPYPNIPLANDNSTRLNFSLTENKTDVYNVFVSLIIKEKSSGNVIEQIPYKFYEFGDITFPYTFRKVGDYVVTLQARINGDSKYQVNPLIANFDISVVKQSAISFNAWIISLTPIIAAIAGIVIYVDFFKKKNNRSSSSNTS
jgi:multisubunit Na+/H+ antiporter MnhE subunit